MCVLRRSSNCTYVLQVRQLKSRGWETEAASLAERERQLQSELASSGGPPSAAAPLLAARGEADCRPLPDVETELLRVQRCKSYHAEDLWDFVMDMHYVTLSHWRDWKCCCLACAVPQCFLRNMHMHRSGDRHGYES